MLIEIVLQLVRGIGNERMFMAKGHTKWYMLDMLHKPFILLHLAPGRAHWALFIPNRMADPTSTLAHIRIRREDVKSGGEAELLINHSQLSRSFVKSVVPLTRSCASREDVENQRKSASRITRTIFFLKIVGLSALMS